MNRLVSLLLLVLLYACLGTPPSPPPDPFLRYTSANEVVEGLRGANAPLAATTPIIDEGEKLGAIDGVEIYILPATTQANGRILIFDSVTAMRDAEAHLRLLSPYSAYTYTRHNAVVFLTAPTTGDQAAQYQRALDQLP